MRSIKIVPGEYYHIHGRGNGRQTIFHDKADYTRFLFGVLVSQAPVSIKNKGRVVDVRHSVSHKSEQRRVLNIPDETVDLICASRYVELVCFCLMPNHYHLLVREKEEKGISRFMQRLLDGYTKYFHAKRKTSGHVLQGPYGIKHVEDDRQFRHLTAYIHRNPREIRGWAEREHGYPWSSLQDYTQENRWGSLLHTDIIHDFFSTKEAYREFVDTSPAKALEFEVFK